MAYGAETARETARVYIMATMASAGQTLRALCNRQAAIDSLSGISSLARTTVLVVFAAESSHQTIPPSCFVASAVAISFSFWGSLRCLLIFFCLRVVHRGTRPEIDAQQEGQVLQLRPHGVRHGPHRQLQGLPDVRRPQAMASLSGVRECETGPSLRLSSCSESNQEFFFVFIFYFFQVFRST